MGPSPLAKGESPFKPIANKVIDQITEQSAYDVLENNIKQVTIPSKEDTVKGDSVVENDEDQNA